MQRPVHLALALALALAVAACGRTAGRTPTAVPFATSRAGLPTTLLTTADRTIRVEVAADPASRELGLGGRDGLAPDQGMLFDLGRPIVAAFWMKGMRFAIDMAWIGEDSRVVGVTRDVQPQPGAPDSALTLYRSPSPVRYVLELNAGAAERLGVSEGATLGFDLPPAAPTPSAP